MNAGRYELNATKQGVYEGRMKFARHSGKKMNKYGFGKL